METCLVSVIIPCHNNNETISQAVSSVLTEKRTPLEIIIVDDGATLDQKLLPFPEDDPEMIRVFTLKKTRGAAYARNLGVKKAKGQYVAFLDADDWWAGKKLEKQLLLIRKYQRHKKEEPVLCFTGRQLCRANGEITEKYIHAPKRIDYRSLLKHNAVNCSSVILKRETALKHPMEEDGNLHEDYLCWLQILREGGFAAGIDEPLLYYRVNRSSKSGNKLKSAVMTYRVYRKLQLPLYKRIFYFISYTWNGIRKYL